MSASPDVGLATTATSSLITTLMVLSGFMLRPSAIPPFLRWVVRVNFIHELWSGLMANHFTAGGKPRCAGAGIQVPEGGIGGWPLAPPLICLPLVLTPQRRRHHHRDTNINLVPFTARARGGCSTTTTSAMSTSGTASAACACGSACGRPARGSRCCCSAGSGGDVPPGTITPGARFL